MANPRQKLSASLVSSILSFIQPFATKQIKDEFNIILHPCCTPAITACNGTGNVVLNITDPSLGARQISIIISNADYSTIYGTKVVTLANDGTITSTVTTSGSAGTYLVTLIPVALNVSKSSIITRVIAC